MARKKPPSLTQNSVKDGGFLENALKILYLSLHFHLNISIKLTYQRFYNR